jgi:branched-chain amino acid transport system ATP-binding protein
MDTLIVEDLDVFYREFQALFGVSITVAKGETVAILGANGAGKTTLLQTIAGALHPRGGRISYQGKSILAQSAHALCKQGISLVPEGRRIFPSLTVKENLQIGAYARRAGAWNLQEVYRLFPILAERANVAGIDLSGGQQQMLAIGRALMNNPDMLLLDELSLGLAPVVVKELYRVVQRIAHSGTTIVLVEQDLHRSMQVADTVYCLLEGRVSLYGSAATLSMSEISHAYFGI